MMGQQLLTRTRQRRLLVYIPSEFASKAAERGHTVYAFALHGGTGISDGRLHTIRKITVHLGGIITVPVWV